MLSKALATVFSSPPLPRSEGPHASAPSPGISVPVCVRVFAREVVSSDEKAEGTRFLS